MNQKKISQEYEKAIQYIYELMKSGELSGHGCKAIVTHS